MITYKVKFLIFLTLGLLDSVLLAEENLYLFSQNYAMPGRREFNLQYKIDYNSRACIRCGEENLNNINHIQQWIGMESGISENLTAVAFGIMTYGVDSSNFRADSFYAGTRFRVTGDDKYPFGLALTLGYLQETTGIPVLQAGGIISKDEGRINLTTNLLFEKAFQQGRDDIDMFLTAGISYRVSGMFRSGIEYAGQDLEDIWEKEEAEGGTRHIVGSVTRIGFNQDNTQLIFTPAYVFSPIKDGFIIRGMVSHKF